ncbi:MAG TPA: hypothetical protein VH583_00235 [Vicinamibacterales bacterium]
MRSAILLIVALPLVAAAQSLSYTKGQNVAPAYEGWEQAPDGTKYFVFGYMNRNWEEEIDVPVGAENGFSLGGDKAAAPGGGRGAGAPGGDRGVGAPGVNMDQGQPTHFLPRRNRFIFKVRVPQNFGDKDELVWTLTTHGKTEKAYATLRPDYILDDVVKASETGALGAGTSSPEVRGNKPPVLHIVEANTRNVKAWQPITLTSEVKDDGIPKRRGIGAGAAVRANGAGGTNESPNSAAAALANAAMRPPVRITVGKNVGLHVTWFLYRGPSGAKVTFDPPQVKAWEDTRAGSNSPWAPMWVPPPIPDDGKQPVTVTFSEPGTYVLRCRADDGALVSDEELTVVVTK